MSSKKKRSTTGAVAPAPQRTGSVRNGNAAAAASGKETNNTWGWGRPSVPPPERDVFAFEKANWWWIGFLAVSIPAASSYGVVHFAQISAWWIVLLLPLIGVLTALPVLTAVLMPLSWKLDPAGPGNPEKYFRFNDKAFERKWKGRKIPIEELYEAYFDEKLDLLDGETAILDVLYERHTFSRSIITMSHVKFFLLQFIPELVKHTRAQDTTQVREHYDRGDDFYNGFLGPSMIYTSGIWHTEDDTLEQAQINKMELIAQKIHLKQGDKHLDLGCGWGTFINYCAKNYGTESYGVTLGLNQTAYQKQTGTEEGVYPRAQALCMDYRDAATSPITKDIKFDKITCLEMSEHVGVKNYAAFVQQVRKQLKDDGIFYLQIAGLRRAWQFEDFNWGLFMGKYIFPGADASCPLGWVIEQLEGGGFEIRSEETIGIHYSATIRCWLANWLRPQVAQEIQKKYGVRMYRLWAWFLAWSVISPEQGSASCYQIVAHKNTRRFNRKQFIAERANWQI